MTARDWMDHLDALHAEATPGEWRHELHGRGTNVVQGVPWSVCMTGSDMERYAVEDAKFIAAAHDALPALTGALRAVLDLCDIEADAAHVPTAEMRGYSNALRDIRTLITEHLTTKE